MDLGQIVVPVLGIVAAAAVTFYAVSFAELREVLEHLLQKSPSNLIICFSSSFLHILISTFLIEFYKNLYFFCMNRNLSESWRTLIQMTMVVALDPLQVRGREGPGGKLKRKPENK
ncbi:hypothetical protein AXF42_Ash003939 [Apostasia shenzhenica]|uniref:Uncharacterized protein n=1 Tax=Apostasia shenzhenica TaxID=1088818 RepID=A0A2I0AIB5_9ASPA|nr:hypothetical protein AXF42_Ash003939 [Apostasia shenzhenica]